MQLNWSTFVLTVDSSDNRNRIKDAFQQLEVEHVSRDLLTLMHSMPVNNITRKNGQTMLFDYSKTDFLILCDFFKKCTLTRQMAMAFHEIFYRDFMEIKRSVRVFILIGNSENYVSLSFL